MCGDVDREWEELEGGLVQRKTAREAKNFSKNERLVHSAIFKKGKRRGAKTAAVELLSH